MSVVIKIVCDDCCAVLSTCLAVDNKLEKTAKTMRADLARSGGGMFGTSEDICPACLRRRADARRLRQGFYNDYGDDDIILGEMRDCGDK